MICIVKRNAQNEITGWIIASDYADAWPQAGAAGENDLAEYLRNNEGLPEKSHPARHELPLSSARYTILRATRAEV